MDEVNDSSISVSAEGQFYRGPRSYILKRSYCCSFASSFVRIGLVNQILILPCKYKIASHKSLSSNCHHSRWFHTRVKSTSRIGPHNLDVISVVIGSLLGDAKLELPTRGLNARFGFNQSIIHEAYFLYIFSIFQSFCSANYRINSYFDSRTEKTYVTLNF